MLLFLFATFLLANCEIYSSRFDIEKLMDFDKHMVTQLDKYLKSTEENLKQLNKLVKNFKEEHKSIKGVKGYLDNPINTFFFVRRLTKDFGEIRTLIINASKAFEAKYEKESKLMQLPEEDDFPGVIEGFIRLKHLYNLNVTSFAAGTFLKDKATTVKHLTAQNYYEIGNQALNEDLYRESMEWFNEALKFCRKEKCEKGLMCNIMESQAFGKYMLRDPKSAYEITNKILKINPSYPGAEANSKIYFYEATRTPISERSLIDPLKRPTGNFSASELSLFTTRGIIWPDDLKSKYFCSYSHNNLPHLRIGPLKEEILSIKPRIVSYKNVIKEKEIELLKKLSLPKLNNSEIPSVYSGNMTTQGVQSKSAWLKDSDHSVVSGLSKRVESLTGLGCRNSEPLEVVNFAYGGFAEPHIDVKLLQFPYYEQDSFKARDRYATVLFQLEDSSVGGHLIFPFLKLMVPFEKGSAVFWFNIDECGSTKFDFSMWLAHSITPVIKGQKWIAHKFLSEEEQIFRRPCPLKHFTTETLPSSYGHTLL